MKHYSRAISNTVEVSAIAWGVFLIEDGLFNIGSIDIKEFSIGLTFFIIALLAVLVQFRRKPWIARVSPRFQISVLILAIIIYTGSTYTRWLSRDEASQSVIASDSIVAHIESSNEWIMLPKSLLQRPAHWYESSVHLSYLTKDGQQSLSIYLPAKFISLKSIKEM
jgi:hypothetical protein